jgi:hypothetical protein
VQIEKDYTFEVHKNVYRANSNSHYVTDLGVSRAKGAGNTQIGLLKAFLRWAL